MLKNVRLFDTMYSSLGRASIPPETLLKAQLLIALYTIRSERQFCEQLGYNLLFRWFLDMDMVSPPFDATTFTKNRERLQHDACGVFFKKVVDQARQEGLLSSEHFSVDGTLIEAWASMKASSPKTAATTTRTVLRTDAPKGKAGAIKKSKRRDRNGWKNFCGAKRTNETHHSLTDPEARMMRKGNGQSANEIDPV